MTARASGRIWYVAYGSNLALQRFRVYLTGGPVPGGARDYPGCRDPQPPTEVAALHVPGGLVFAGRSRVWGGGIAFLDPCAGRTVAARAYLLTCGQAADVVAQEIRQPPGGTWARHTEEQLASVTEHLPTSITALYDTLHLLGDRDGVPMFTLTHGDVGSMPTATPTAPYVRWITVGLREAHGWDAGRIARYLSAVPGAGAGWTPGAIAALARDAAGP